MVDNEFINLSSKEKLLLIVRQRDYYKSNYKLYKNNIRKLILAGAFDNILIDDIPPLIDESIEKNDYKLVRFLLQNGVSPNKSKYGTKDDPSHPISLVNTVAIANLLMEYGAKPNFEDSNYPILHYISNYSGKRAELIPFFIKLNFNPNELNNDNDTPLHILAENSKEDFNKNWLKKLRYLIKAGADINIKNKKDLTFMDIITKTIGDQPKKYDYVIKILNAYK